MSVDFPVLAAGPLHVPVDTLTAWPNARVRRGQPRLIELMHELDATVVIEGIETQEHLAIALNSGCDLLQGYFLGEPRYVKEV
ncbi:MAG: hypothetical protein H6R07_521 [Proteobacteria bacterium]|nr:hypothetical protein [Pseudomonadota bacterium]